MRVAGAGRTHLPSLKQLKADVTAFMKSAQ
jgi:hypothetical protein